LALPTAQEPKGPRAQGPNGPRAHEPKDPRAQETNIYILRKIVTKISKDMNHSDVM
jgi:hypothetical protein